MPPTKRSAARPTGSDGEEALGAPGAPKAPAPPPGVPSGDGRAVGRLLDLLLGTPTVEGYLDEVVRMAHGLSPAVAAVGVMLRKDGTVETVATSDPLAAAVDEVQFGMGAGPCLQAIVTGEIVDVLDVVDESRWGPYPEHALSRGVRSSLSLPLRVDGSVVGALNTYSAEPAGLDGDVRARLLGFAAQAEVALALALRHAQQLDVVDQLHTAMQSRSAIDQALGIIMARQRCTSEEAFAVLRSASQHRNRKIADIAVELITATTGSTPRAGRFEV